MIYDEWIAVSIHLDIAWSLFIPTDFRYLAYGSNDCLHINPSEVISRNNTLNSETACNSCDLNSWYCFILCYLDFNVLVSKDIVNSVTVISSPSKIATSRLCVIISCDVVLYCKLLLLQ